MRNCLIVALAAVAAGAHALVIDSFDDGTFVDDLSSGSNSVFVGASVPGGARFVSHQILANPLNLVHTAVVVNGILALDSRTDVVATSTVAYGTNALGVFGFTDLNLDLSGQDRFRFNIASNDLPTTIQVVLFQNGSGTSFSGIHSVAPDMVLTDQTLDVMFSDFAGFNFSDVDGIAFIVNTSASGDIVFNSFEAVPEPATFLALGTGIAGLLAARRKRAR